MLKNELPADFLPDTAGPERVAQQVLATLTALPFVRAVALFGSLAEGRADPWSDVDLWVACDDAEQTQWVAASALRAAHPVLCYRMFGNAPQPSGRYWFVHESPFHKIDISFESRTRYQDLLSHPEQLYYPITVREVYRQSEPPAATALPSPFHPVEITEYERELGMRCYLLLRGIKYFQRGEWERAELEARYHALRATLGDTPRAAVMGSGAIGELAYRFIDIARACLRLDS